VQSCHLHSDFSSSVSWITSGTLKASCSHFVNTKGTRCPRCSASDDGPYGGNKKNCIAEAICPRNREENKGAVGAAPPKTAPVRKE